MNSYGKSKIIGTCLMLPFMTTLTSCALETSENLDEYALSDDEEYWEEWGADVPEYSPVESGGKYGFVDRDGVLVIDYIFDDTKGLSGDTIVAPVKIGDKWGYIKIRGMGTADVIPAVFDDAWHFTYVGVFGDYVADVKYQGKYGRINVNGEFVVEPRFDNMLFFSGTNCSIVVVEGKSGIMDSDGNYLVEPKYDGIRRPSNGMTAVKIKDRWGYIDRDNELAIPPKFEQAGGFSSDTKSLAPVQYGGRWGYIDLQGNMVITPRYDEAEMFHHGAAEVSIGERNFIIDTSGKVVKEGWY